MQKIIIYDGKIKAEPGGVYDMIEGNWVEHQVVKLHILQRRLQQVIDGLCDHNELIEERTPGCHELMKIAETIYDNEYKDLVENYKPIKVEFPAYLKGEITVPSFLLEEPFVDQSWHNDACPSFFFPDGSIIIWVDWDNPMYRECSEMKFTVVRVEVEADGGQDIGEMLYECETEEELKHWIETATY